MELCTWRPIRFILSLLVIRISTCTLHMHVNTTMIFQNRCRLTKWGVGQTICTHLLALITQINSLKTMVKRAIEISVDGTAVVCSCIRVSFPSCGG